MTHKFYRFKGTAFEFATLAASIVAHWPAPTPFEVDLDRLDPNIESYILNFIRLQASGQGRVIAVRWSPGDKWTHLKVELIDDYWQIFPNQDGWAILYNEMSQHGLIEPSPYATVTTADGREFDIDQESESTAIAAMGGSPLKLHGENWHEFITANVAAQMERDKPKSNTKQEVIQAIERQSQNQPHNVTPAEPNAGDERKEQVDFVLVTALEEERDAVLAQLPGYKKLPPSKEDIRIYFQADLSVAFSDGQEGVYQVIVMPLLGMGRVQAAMATADAIRRWHPRYILLVGIAGGIANRGVKIGDVLISDQVVDYELQKVTAQGQEVRWEIQRADPQLLTACQNFMEKDWQQQVRTQRPDSGEPQRHIGPIASGDKVIAFDEILARYQNVWPKLIGVEMEAAGAAAATFQSAEKPGFFMVRVVSDLADEQKGSAEVEKWRSYACEAAASFAIALLKSGPVSLGEK